MDEIDTSEEVEHLLAELRAKEERRPRRQVLPEQALKAFLYFVREQRDAHRRPAKRPPKLSVLLAKFDEEFLDIGLGSWSQPLARLTAKDLKVKFGYTLQQMVNLAWNYQRDGHAKSLFSVLDRTVPKAEEPKESSFAGPATDSRPLFEAMDSEDDGNWDRYSVGLSK